MAGLMDVYQQRRDRALAEQIARRREAFLKVPALAANDARYRKAQQARVDGADKADAEAELEAVCRERALLLKSCGFDADYLDIKYTCAACSDSGYTNDGRPCACMEQLRFERNTAKSNLSRFAEENFAAWSLDKIPADGGQRENSQKLKAILSEYSESFPEVSRVNLLFLGDTGLGKSFAAHCVGNAVKQKGFSVRKYTAPQFFRMVMESVVRERDYGVIDELSAVDLLILDDLGSEPSAKDISETTLYSLLDERTMKGKANIITSNLGIKALIVRYGERSVSRLMDSRYTRMLGFSGKDLRLL